MADAITGDTQLVATKQDLIASKVQRELQAKSKFFSTITDVSKFAVKGAKTIEFPKLTSFTATNRASGTQGDSTVLTASTDSLALDQRPYIAWIIDSSDAIQTTLNAQLENAGRAATGQARYVDQAIITELETVGIATTTAGDITRDIVLDMREFLLGNEANMDELTLAISVDQEKAMLKIAEFTEARIYGSSNVPSGVIGTVYGVPVMVSSALGADKFYMYEKTGLATGFQRGPTMSTQGANEFGAGSERTALDQLFGVTGLQLGEQGAGAAESPLVAKDNNI